MTEAAKALCPGCGFPTAQAELDAYDGKCACCFAPEAEPAPETR